MSDLTRRKFLTGAPAVAAAVVVGVSVVPRSNRPVLTINQIPAFIHEIVRDNPQRMYDYWRAADNEIIALQPKAPYLVTPKNIAGAEQII